MKTYEKIETLYQRDTEGTKRLMPGVWRDATVLFCSELDWEWTEKIDGTNIRVYWDGHTVTFGGRTENASIPTFLYNRLRDLFGTNEAEQLFEQMFGEKEVILFGEGYGAKIQKGGGNYIPDGVNFILFDVMIGNNYQPRETVDQIARAFSVPSVPVIGHGPLAEAEAFVRTNPRSRIGNCEMEGLVCRPCIELRDRCGNRLIVKIKAKDFKEEDT